MSRTTGTRTNRRARGLTGALLLMSGMGIGILTGPSAAAQTATPVLPTGAVASEDMRLTANIPKNGAFAPEGAFSSDLAFQDRYAFGGNYNGFTVYDLKNPSSPKQVAQVQCFGAQNDISVYGDLLVLSVDQRLTNDSCTAAPASAAQSLSGAYWEGIRLFDISDPRAPQYLKSVETDCGSHTHTLVPDGESLFVYVSSYSPSPAQAKCLPPHDKISVVEVPLGAPETASVVSEPVLFPGGGNPGGNGSSATSGCHDITAYPEKGIAAGACMGEGVIIDITDPVAPVVTETVLDTTNFAFWHSATFNDEASTVIFTDELGGGGAATCNPTVGPNKGANGIYSLAGGQLSFESYYKISREQSPRENCVAHNGNLVPVKGGDDIMVQAWYQGGISLFDFTDPSAPEELAWFDRGELSNQRLILGGSWSAYYYEGYVYSNDIQKGLDVIKVQDPAVAGAKSSRSKNEESVNPQTQVASGRR